MKIKTRFISCLLAFILVLSATGCVQNSQNQSQSPDNTQQQAAFDELIKKDFQDTLKNSYTYMHQITVSPEKYGVDPKAVQVRFDDILSHEKAEQLRSDYAKLEEELKAIKYDALREDQKETYKIFNEDLKNSINLLNKDFIYMQNLFSPSVGLHSNLTIFFMEYDFYKPQDVTDYITLMKDSKRYIDDALAFTVKQAENGYFMSNHSADMVIDYCDKLIKNKDNSFLLKSILSNIDKFSQLTDEQKASYKKEATAAFYEYLMPAYQSIRDTLSSLKKDTNNQLGLAHLPKGKEYYEVLFREQTGSSRSIDETKKLLLKYLKESTNNINAIIEKNPEVYEQYIEDDVSTNYDDISIMHNKLEEFKNKNFPPIKPVKYTIDYLDPDMDLEGIGAYYMQSPIDGDTTHKMKVNPSLKPFANKATTFSIVAHEGFPGHMYQRCYVLENIDNPYRQSANFLGYLEGYATYVEQLSLEYLGLDPNYVALAQNLAIAQNCLIALSDIGIHYDGWDKKKMQDLFDKSGQSIGVESVYNQLQGEPAAFLPYYVGHLEFLELRKDAQKQLGSKFKELDFHTAILKSGSAPFDVVKENVEKYIASAK